MTQQSQSRLDAEEASDLLRACAEGQRSALRRLYDAWAPTVYALTLRITRQKSLAEDATHDAFLQIWQQAARFDPTRGRADVWMFSIARYRAIDLMRRRQRETSGYEADETASEEVDALDLLIADSDGQALRRCLRQLDEARQRLIAMAFVEGLSHSALASRLAVPLGTIKSTIRRSLSTLRQCLET